jgi:signal transduction histidine kinase
VESQADDIEISVRDSDVGMDTTLRLHVFELFTQGKRSTERSQGGLGLGLGLALVKAWSACTAEAWQRGAPDPAGVRHSVFFAALS